MKGAILRVYELVPEAYRQKFRHHRKGPDQMHVEFAREKGMLFAKWIASCNATDYSSLRELIMLEEFKKCLPEHIVVYLNEQKVNSLSAAAVLADEYVLTQKYVFSSVFTERSRSVSTAPCTQPSHVYNVTRKERECFYCHQPGHVIANCVALKRKEQPQNMSLPKGIGLITHTRAQASKSDSDVSLSDPVFLSMLPDEAVSDEKPESVVSPPHEDVVRPAQHAGSDKPLDFSTLPVTRERLLGYPIVILVLLLALQYFEVYVYVWPIVVFTCPDPFLYWSRVYNHNQHLMRWALIMRDYNTRHPS